jgi:hypothetical protein
LHVVSVSGISEEINAAGKMTDSELLAEAKLALHRLNVGEAIVEARDSTGEMVRYTPANASRLKAYIAELTAKIAGTSTTIRPFRPVFS